MVHSAEKIPNNVRKRFTKDISNNVLFYEYIIARICEARYKRGKLCTRIQTLQFASLKYLYTPRIASRRYRVMNIQRSFSLNLIRARIFLLDRMSMTRIT